MRHFYMYHGDVWYFRVYHVSSGRRLVWRAKALFPGGKWYVVRRSSTAGPILSLPTRRDMLAHIRYAYGLNDLKLT